MFATYVSAVAKDDAIMFPPGEHPIASPERYSINAFSIVEYKEEYALLIRETEAIKIEMERVKSKVE